MNNRNILVEILLYGDYQRWMNVKIITDSEPTLESIGSTKQIDRKQLRGMVTEMKEKLTDGETPHINGSPRRISGQMN